MSATPRKTRPLTFGAAIALCLACPATSLANPVHEEVMALAEAEQFSQGLARLASEPDAHKSDYDHRFLRARLLAWSGQHATAQTEVDALIAEHPGDPDLALLRGNLAFYQGRFAEADAYFRSIVARFPDYADAEDALRRVRAAQADADNAKRAGAWRIDMGTGGSSLDLDGLDNWSEQSVSVAHTRGRLTTSGTLQRFSRFGMTDVSLGAGLADATRGGLDWSVQAAVTPDADFRPDWSAGGMVGTSVADATPIDGAVLQPSLTYRLDDYGNQTIHNVQPDLTLYMANGAEVGGRLIGTVPSAGEAQLGWLARTRLPVTDRLSAKLGYARAPEAIAGETITTESVFGGMSYAVRDDLEVHLDVGRDARENSYTRTHANVALTYKR